MHTLGAKQWPIKFAQNGERFEKTIKLISYANQIESVRFEPAEKVETIEIEATNESF